MTADGPENLNERHAPQRDHEGISPAAGSKGKSFSKDDRSNRRGPIHVPGNTSTRNHLCHSRQTTTCRVRYLFPGSNDRVLNTDRVPSANLREAALGICRPPSVAQSLR